MKVVKRVLLFLGVLLVVSVLGFGALVFNAFQGNAPLPDSADLNGGARLVKDGIVAFFVLPAGGSKVALVDCGNDPNARRVLDELKRQKLSPDDVTAIFLTHGHGDHTAGCHNFPKAEVMGLSGDVSLAAGTEAGHSMLTRWRKNGPDRAVTISRVLKDGETVTVGRLPVRVFAVPGHTAGSAAYLADQVLYLGDSANSRIDGSLAGAPSIFTDNVEENRASLRRLFRTLKDENLTVKTMAMAHSAPLEGTKALEAFAAKAK